MNTLPIHLRGNPLASRNSSEEGHASQSGAILLLTLLLVSLLLMLAVAFSVFVRLEARSIANHQNQLNARKNAMLGLNLALGRLQFDTGPDQRVSGKADLLLPEGVNITGNTTGAQARQEVDEYWNNRRNRHWTGAWVNQNTDEFDADNPAAYQPEPGRLSWLVGSGRDMNMADPTAIVEDLSPETTPSQRLTDDRGTPHVLLVSPDPHVGGAEALARAVTAPLVSMEADSAPGSGRYAWWVGDEGVKARANLSDGYAGESDEASRLRRVASAQRQAIEAMTIGGNDGMAPYYEVNHPEFWRLNDLKEFTFLESDPAHAGELSKRFHDLTLHSRGVLSDVRDGGLKRDLSYLLGQPQINGFRSAMAAIYGQSAVSFSEMSNQVLSEAVTPLMERPSSYTREGGVPSTSVMSHTPTWEQLWSFHNMGNPPGASPPGVLNAGGEAVPRPQAQREHGIHPISMQAKLFYEFEVDGDGRVSVRIRPLVVLANPYSVPIAASDYVMRFPQGSQLEVRYGSLAEGASQDNPSESDFPSENELRTLGRMGIEEVALTLRSEGIPPGEAHVFTLESDGIVIPNTTNAQRALEVILTNDYDPTPSLNYSNVAMIPENTNEGEDNYAVLYMRGAGIRRARLHLDYEPNNPAQGVLQDVQVFDSSSDRSGQEAFDFLVFPTRAGGTREGGGVSYTLFDSGEKSPKQHSLFYQQNYRTNFLNGFHGPTSDAHLLEWGRGHKKNGFPGNEEFFAAHLLGLTEDDVFRNVRWGPRNTGDPNSSYETAPPSGMGPDVGFRNWMYDIPTPEVPLSSLGQLQHLNLNSYIDQNSLGNQNKTLTVQSWQVNYPVSNSYANPRILRHRLIDNIYSGYFYDSSYIWNHIFWDRFYFSSYPATGSFDFESDRLVNERYRPFRNPDHVSPGDEGAFRGNGNPADASNSRMASQNLLVEGAFNINSTSPDAWKALFASLREVPIGNENAVANRTAPFVRTLLRLGGADAAETANHANAWNGFRNLTQAQINELADEMVLQVRLRGPFLSMADFVNRRLVRSNDDPHQLGVKGALQSSIDTVINQREDIAPLFRIDTNTHPNRIVDLDLRATTLMDGFPGYLLQADVLSALGPHITARSDTFRIRTYGDVVNPDTNEPEARAWCEAIVQRLPDYVDPHAHEPHEDPAPNTINGRFGRRYQIVSFRWLTPEEI